MMEDEHLTKIEFLLGAFPNLSKQDIMERLNSAPPSERSTDALIAYFLAQPEKEQKGEFPKDHQKENTTTTMVEENVSNEEKENIPPDFVEPQKSRHLIQDDDLDESFEVSPDPVEYSALTGKIEKTEDQLQQEEDDLKLAQQLYEEELLRFSQQTAPAAPQPYQLALDPYHKPPPQPKKTTTSTTSTANPPTKRPAASSNTDIIKRSREDTAAQIQEIRKLRESQWLASGGKTPAANANNQRGFDAGFYNNIKETRNKKHKEYLDSKLKSQKNRVQTIEGLKNAERQALIDSGVFNASDSPAVQIGKEALELTNKFRKENKLPPLIWHPALCNIGAQHSKNMAEHKVAFGHDGFQERIRQYPMPHRSAAENVAMSKGVSDVAQTAVQGWIHSPGHRKNLLSHSEYCGIGCYQGSDGSWYLTQLFAG